MNDNARRVLLIHSQFVLPNPAGNQEPPLGLIYLGTVLSQNGFQVKILDASNRRPKKQADGTYFYGMDNNEVEQYVKEYNPHIVGLGCFFSSKWPFVLQLAELVKRNFKESFIVAGGIYPSMSPVESLADAPDIDFCMAGEAEYSFLELCKTLSQVKNGSVDSASFEKIKKVDGIVYRENGKVLYNHKKDFIQNLDEIPFPDYDLMEGGAEQYFSQEQPIFRLGKKYFPMLSSRSCPAACTFCNMKFTHGEEYRYRSPENVIKEIVHNKGRWGVTAFHFADDNVSLLKKRFKDLCNILINMNEGYKWASLNGMMINTLDDEIVDLMSKSGCVRVALAIESGDNDIRTSTIRKPIKNTKIKDVAEALRKNGIFVSGFFIVGFLEDSDESIKESKKLIADLNLNWAGIFALQPYPGTEIYQILVEKGVIKSSSTMQRDNKKEFIQPSYELYEGYSSKVQAWQKSLYFTFFLSLLKHPLDLFRYRDVYFNTKYIKSFFMTFVLRRADT